MKQEVQGQTGRSLLDTLMAAFVYIQQIAIEKI